MKKYNIEDLPVFFIEHAEVLSKRSAENGGLAFLTAVAFLVERHYEDFKFKPNESEEKAYLRYRMERTTKQVSDLFETEEEGN